MPRVYTEVEVDVELDDFSDDDLIEELESRGFDVRSQTPTELITKIYELRRLGRDYQQELTELIYASIGKIV